MKHLKRLIGDRGFTQASLAAKMGCDQSQISHWVSGRRKPSHDNLLALAGSLGCCVEALVYDEPTNDHQRRACESFAAAMGLLWRPWGSDGPQYLERLQVARDHAHQALIDIEVLMSDEPGTTNALTCHTGHVC